LADYITYRNQGATRNQQLDANLVKRLAYLQNLGVTMDVFSGGQPTAAEGGARVGSVRHDHGGAADAFFYKDGRKLDWNNEADRPIFEKIVADGKAAGVTGFGAGPGYMQPGSMHIGMGTPGVWGAGGSGDSAPDWLRSAYAGATAAPANPAAPGAKPDVVADVLAAGGNAPPGYTAPTGAPGTPETAAAAPAAADKTIGGMLGLDVPKGLPAMLQFSSQALAAGAPKELDATPQGGLLRSQPIEIQQAQQMQPKQIYKPWEMMSMFRGRA
jgi:hypothetical protein